MRSKIDQIIDSITNQEDKDYLIDSLMGRRDSHAHMARALDVSEAAVRRWREAHTNGDQQETPKILLWDIESSPILGYVWGLWDQNVIRIKEDWNLLTVSWTWYGSGEYHAKQLCDFRGYKKGSLDDYKLTEFARDLLDQADYSIAHNGNAFDVKKINGKILEHGLTPPSPHTQIDTLRIAKQNMKISANSLDHLGKLLGVGSKLKHPGFDMWLGCMEGDKKSWEMMSHYAIQDVILLENVFNRLKPWVKGINFGLFSGEQCCPNCGSTDLYLGGKFKTQTTARKAFQCGHCGTWSKQKLNGKYI